MISAILFGRNDDYGGGYGHRAVLSINLLAKQLDDADEIVFVDWNTEDGAPTLPQAVAHSLTGRARALLRTIKVSSGIHAEHVGRGAFMPIVPVVAYNTAIRRANPANKWILITTTDMLLVSRDVGRTLSNVATTLQDGVYGLPRFELPHWIWQGLDPCEPAAAATCLSAFGKRLHLEEAIRLPRPDLFDAPGDFQLVLRADLVSIDGLDEGMSMGALGPDSNLLKRLELRGRSTESLERHFAGYHCDHTSFPSSLHRAGRMENDISFFVEEVEKPDLPFQRSSWGLAGRQLPEVTFAEGEAVQTEAQPRLRSADSSRAALLAGRLTGVAAIMGPEQRGLYVTTPRFNRAGYPTKHIVAFLLDQIFGETGPVFYVGTNELLASLLKAILERLEPRRALACFRPEDRAGFEQRHAGIGREDGRPLLVFDFGIDAGKTTRTPAVQDCDEPTRRSLHHVRERFAWCVRRQRELGRGEGDDIRIAAINTINTEFEQMVAASLDCGRSPFITRMLSGRVRPIFPPPVPVVSHPAADHMAAHLGRTRGVHVGEFARAWAIARRLLRDMPAGRVPSAYRAPSIDALLDWPGITAAMDANSARVAEVRSVIAASREIPPGVASWRTGNDTVATSKLASAHDWEVPEWYEVAHWYLGDHRSYNVFQRHRRDWEHIHFLYCLRRLGILDTDAEVVVLAHTPDRFANVLARRVRKVHLVNIGWISNKRFFRVPELRLASSIQVYRGLSDPALRDLGASALIAQGHNATPFGAAGLGRACPALKPDGIVGVSLDACVGATPDVAMLGRWLHPLPGIDDLANDRLRARAALPGEFKPIPSVDWSVDPESFELIAPPAGWRWRQMTAEKHGRRITSAIRWFSRLG
jgi:hypothetical protein